MLASNENTTASAEAPHITFIFLDTSPCIRGYRGDNPANWDPCSTQFPTCSPGATDDDFEGTCNFHANIVEQSCDDQYVSVSCPCCLPSLLAEEGDAYSSVPY